MTVRITGRVQGVGFRWWVRRQAAQLGLTGWVMNADDERGVELVAEGAPADLDVLESCLRRGPDGARVEAVHASRSSASGEFDEFGIMRG